MIIKTPYYLIHESLLINNLKKIQYIRENSGAKILLALKCFSTWSTFKLLRKYLDGTTSSSLYEAKLGHEKFGGETHAYCVGFSDDDMKYVPKYADKIIFNSETQLRRYGREFPKSIIGIRINPGISTSHYDIANPARKFSRLGIKDLNTIQDILPLINGAMFHFNCENKDISQLSSHLRYITKTYKSILKNLSWISIGGGISFTQENYPLKDFCQALKNFSRSCNGAQIYLEPGDAVVYGAGEFVTSVVDIITRDGADIAIVDASIEAHTLDLLTYRLSIKPIRNNPFIYFIAGRSCLAGDVFGQMSFPKKLSIGDLITIPDSKNFTTLGYTMVKKNWFNGLQMPSIVIKKLDDSLQLVRKFTYTDFITNLS